MTLLPAIRDELVGAAQRQLDADAAAPSTRWMRLRRPRLSLLTIALTFALVGGTASAVAVLTGVVGGPPSNDFPRVPGEEASGFVRGASPRVLGTLRIAGAPGPIEVVGYTARWKDRHQICLDLGMPDGANMGACGPTIPLRPREFVGLIGASDTAPRLATGVTRSPVGSVEVTYDDDGAKRSTRAELVRVGDTQAASLGSPPFTYFAAAVPTEATRLAFTGRNAANAVLWTSNVSR